MRTPSFLIFLILTLAVAAFVGALAYLTFSPEAKTGGLASDVSEARPPNILPPSRPVISSADPIRGNPRAPITIVEFGDFLCLACAQVETALQKVLNEYEGKVKLIWKDLPNTARHPLAQKAAEAARCAGEQGAFWPYHDRILEETEQGQSLTEEGLSLTARELGLDTTQFSQCLESETMKDTVERSFNEALLLGVDATPYFFVGTRRLSGALNENELKQAIDAVYGTPPQ